MNVKVANDYIANELIVPYGTQFYSRQALSQFLSSYGAWLKAKGMIFDTIESGKELNWITMTEQYLYWSQNGWEDGAVITVNPSARSLVIDKDNNIVQPLTIQENNYILNQNLAPIALQNLSIQRVGTNFTIIPLNDGDTLAYGNFNLGSIEHGIVFDNLTLFNDVIYNLVTKTITH